MPTDAFEIADSQDAEYNNDVTGARLRSVLQSNLAVPLMQGIRTSLLAAGWTEQSQTPAKFTITMPYGLPRQSSGPESEDKPEDNGTPLLTFDRELKDDRVSFLIYDPKRRSPGTQPDTIYIAAGTTVQETVDALVEAIDENSLWHVVDYGQNGTRGPWYIDVEANTPGIGRNAVIQGGSGSVRSHTAFWCSAPQPWGGGSVLRSEAAGGGWLEVWMYLPRASTNVAFEFRSSQEGSEPTFYLAPAIRLLAGLPTPTWKYTIIANQFQFALFVDGQNHFLFASQPYLQGGCEYAALILSNGARNALRWRGTNGKWASARDGELTSVMSGNHAGCYPGFFVLRQIGTPILTTQGFAITESAYIGLPTGRATSTDGHSRVVGKVWDALVLSKIATLGDKFQHRGLLWQCIFSTQESFGTVRASVWFAYAEAPAE